MAKIAFSPKSGPMPLSKALQTIRFGVKGEPNCTRWNSGLISERVFLPHQFCPPVNLTSEQCLNWNSQQPLAEPEYKLN
jgi:hypothetical protein